MQFAFAELDNGLVLEMRDGKPFTTHAVPEGVDIQKFIADLAEKAYNDYARKSIISGGKSSTDAKQLRFDSQAGPPRRTRQRGSSGRRATDGDGRAG